MDPLKHVSEFYGAEGKASPKLERRSERPGALLTKKIRAVCAACNNTWMSEIEAAAKPCLLKLLVERQDELTHSECQSVARWVVLKTIVGEHASENAALTPEFDRRRFYSDQTIPEYFRIFLGTHSLRTTAAYARHATIIAAIKRWAFSGADRRNGQERPGRILPRG